MLNLIPLDIVTKPYLSMFKQDALFSSLKKKKKKKQLQFVILGAESIGEADLRICTTRHILGQ